MGLFAGWWIMSSLPGRASDSGPDSRNDCRACGSTKWSSAGDCVVCENPCCDRCAAPCVQDVLVCTNCLPTYREAQDDLAWSAGHVPTIAQVEQVAAMVQYPNIREWSTKWVN